MHAAPTVAGLAALELARNSATRAASDGPKASADHRVAFARTGQRSDRRSAFKFGEGRRLRPSSVPVVPVGTPASLPTDPAERHADALAPAVALVLAASGGEGPAPPVGHPIHMDSVLSGSPSSTIGATLRPAVRARLLAATGLELNSVRIHSDPDGIRLANRLQSAAFAYGSEIWFGSERLTMATPAGRHLLAHELVHVALHGHRSMVHRQVLRRDRTPRAGNPGRSGPGSAVDPVVLIEISRRGGSAVLTTRSGARIDGHADDIDLEVGAYKLIPHPAQHIWTIVGSSGGQHFRLLIADPASGEESDVERPLVDAFTVVYDQPNLRVVPGEEPGAEPARVDLNAIFQAMNDILNQTWVHGSDEDLLITMIESVPAAQSAEFLSRLSQTRTNGHLWLDDLDDRISGENNEHLHQALSMQRIRATPEQSVAALAHAPVLPWHDVMGFFEDAATFTSERSGPGKVRIRYLGGTRIVTSTDFGDEIRRLPLDIFISGVEYDDNQPLIIHDYDSGQFVTVVASELAGYEHLGIRNFLSHVATVASFAIPVSAAESVAGRVFVVTLERVLPAAFLLVDENRLNLVRWFPTWGPKMIQYSDTLKTAAAAVGFARLAISGFEMFTQWRAIARSRQALEGAARLDAEAQRVANQLEQQAETAYRQAEGARDAEAARQGGIAAGSDPAQARVPGTGTGTAPLSDSGAQAATATGAAIETPTPAAGQGASRAPVPSTAAGAAVPAADSVAWQGINDETRSMLRGSPQVREALEQSPLAAEVLKFCQSLCYPRFVTEAQIAQLETALERAERLNVAVNEREVQRALHAAGTSGDLDHVIAQIETGVEARVQVGQEFEEAGGVAGQAPAEEVGSVDEGFYQTPTLRNAPGYAHGGTDLTAQARLLEPGSGIGPMPEQIARRLRAFGRFRNFDELRETFWRMVADDRQLSQGWTPQNLARMRDGHPPFVGRIAGVEHATGGGSNAVLQLNHIRAIKNAGGVFDLDNIEIVSPLVHAAVGD